MILPEIKINNKIDKSSIYLPSDTGYFNEWSKTFILSAKKYVPWINLHCHIFDMTLKDRQWCEQHGVSYSSENTPSSLITLDEKRGYWVNMRFYRIPDIFQDNAAVLALDVDGLVVNPISEEEFKRDLSVDWVAMREKGYGSLGGCLGLAPNGKARHIIKNKILEILNTGKLIWYIDQELLNGLVENKTLSAFGMKYVDYNFKSESKVWTGKGNRKYKSKKRIGLPELIEEYRKQLT